MYHSYSTIGIAEHDIANITIYPVPVKNELVLTTSDELLKYTKVVIRNAFGKIEYSNAIPTGSKDLKIDVSKLASGVYYIKMYNSNNELTHLRFTKL